MADKPVVTITGVSGYLGQETCLQFLQDGGFKVRGTVRDKNGPKIEFMKKTFGDLFDQVELVEANLLDAESLMKACAGSTYIVHTASPVQMSGTEDAVVKPALEGTKAVMEAAHAAKVKRVVVTSSVAAVSKGVGMEDPANLQSNFTFKDWSVVEKCGVYEKSKTLAEKYAWDFVEKLPEGEKFELVTICPGLIMGGTASGDFPVGGFIKMVMLGKMPTLMGGSMPCVGLKDSAYAHLQAIKVDAAAGNRYILVASSHMWPELFGWMAEKYKDEYPVTTTLKEDDGKDPFFNIVKCYSNKESIEVLGIKYQHPKEAAIEMVGSMIESGYLKKE